MKLQRLKTWLLLLKHGGKLVFLNRKFLIEITIKPKSDYAFGLYFMNFYF